MIDPKLLNYCRTPDQAAKIQAIIDHGSAKKAAKALGLARQSVDATVKVVKGEAARNGYAPEYDLTHAVAPGQVLRGSSTLYDAAGNQRLQWVKTQADRQAQLDMLSDAVTAIAADIKAVKAVKPPKVTNDQLLTVYPMGDPHVGMYAWSKESGEDFDVEIARRDLNGAMRYLSENTPPTDKALIINLGDFFHADNSANRTARSNNALDVDTRWARVLELGILAMVDCIDIARRKHQQVDVYNAIGNHDEHSSVMLALCLKAWYRDEPRVTIMDTIAKHHYVRFGKVLMGITHGDTIKKGGTGLDALMAADVPQDWADSTKRHWYCGHIHSSNKVELVGCNYESFRHLAPNDAWHQGQGYRSGRDMVAIVHHKDHGEVARATCDISIVRGQTV